MTSLSNPLYSDEGQAHAARLNSLPGLTTAALLRTLKTWERDRQGLAATEGNAAGEEEFSLQLLLEAGEIELESRRDSYTGEYDS